MTTSTLVPFVAHKQVNGQIEDVPASELVEADHCFGAQYFMSQYPEVTVHTSERQKASRLLKSLGWSCFWLQLVLTVVSVLIFGFATLDPNLNLNLKSGIGLLSVLGGMAALCFSLYWCFRYVRLGRKLDAPESALHPSRKETIEVLQLGVLVNLIAMLFTLVSIETIVGSLLLKTLSVPQGAAVYRTGQLVVPIDFLSFRQISA